MLSKYAFDEFEFFTVKLVMSRSLRRNFQEKRKMKRKRTNKNLTEPNFPLERKFERLENSLFVSYDDPLRCKHAYEFESFHPCPSSVTKRSHLILRKKFSLFFVSLFLARNCVAFRRRHRIEESLHEKTTCLHSFEMRWNLQNLLLSLWYTGDRCVLVDACVWFDKFSLHIWFTWVCFCVRTISTTIKWIKFTECGITFVPISQFQDRI